MALSMMGSLSGLALPPKFTKQTRICRAVRTVPCRANIGESAESRRMRESLRVQERTQVVHNGHELDAALTLAGDKLTIVAITSEEECHVGGGDAYGSMAADDTACVQLSASLARVSREADDVRFASIEVVGDQQARSLCNDLGVHTFPTFQYYKSNVLLWQHVGAGAGSGEKLSEGVLYYGGEGADGLKTEEYITEVNSKSDLFGFLEACAAPQTSANGVEFNVPCEKQLAVLDVGVAKDAPAGCLHIFPAVVSLARNTLGFTRWARLNGDSSAEAAALMRDLNVTTVPTFIFYANGMEVDRYSGSDRLELMNRLLNFQKSQGVELPQRPPRKRMTTAEAKEIARAARERERAAGRRSGW